MEGSQGVLFGFRRIQTDPERIDFLEFLVVGILEDNPFLPGKEPPTVVEGPLQQGIARVPVILTFHVDENLPRLPAIGSACRKQDVKIHSPFRDAFVRCVFASDASGIQSILIHRSRADFRRPFQTGKQFGNGTMLIFRETALEDMSQDDFVSQKSAAGSIQRLFFLPRAQIMGNSGRDFHGITIFLLFLQGSNGDTIR
jgi:hypothetical protein